MAKKTIKNFEDFKRIAVEKAFGEKAEFSRKMWEESLKLRYENDEISFRVSDFDNGNIIRDKGVLELFSNMERLDDYIKNEKDLANKTAAVATRHVISAGLNDLLNQYTYSGIDEVYDQIAEEYDISEEVAQEYQNTRNQYLQASENRDENIPLSEASLGQLNAKEKADVYNSVVSTFFDREAWKDKDGNVIEPGKAVHEVLGDVTAYALQMDNDAVLGDNEYHEVSVYDDEFEKEYVGELTKEFASERDIFKVSEIAERIRDFKDNFVDFSTTGNRQDLDEVYLTLDKSPLADIRMEEFVKNQKADKLSHIELDWAESNFDRMVNSLYTKDELRALKQAGIDPAIGILVDGKPVNWYGKGSHEFDTFFMGNTPLENAKVKAEIVSKALQGSKIDICKYKTNDKGEVESDKIVPVKTDATIKERKWSFIRWLMEFFNFRSKTEMLDKIKDANEAKRDYTDYYNQKREYEKQVAEGKTGIEAPEKPKAIADAERRVVTTKARTASAMGNEYYDRFSKDFFGEIAVDGKVFRGHHLQNAFQYTGADGAEYAALKTMDRKPTVVNMALLYGMSKGHPLNEMLDIKNSEIRKKLGQEFVEELHVKSYDWYLESTNKDLYKQYQELKEIWMEEKYEEAKQAGKTEKAEETKKEKEARVKKDADKLEREVRKASIMNNLKDSQKSYGKYLIDRREKLERFCLESAEALKKQPISVVSPFDTEAFIQNYPMLSMMGSMVKDWSQSFAIFEREKRKDTDKEGVIPKPRDNWFKLGEKDEERINFGLDNADKQLIEQINERACTVYDYCSDLNNFNYLTLSADSYFGFLADNNYATKDYINEEYRLSKAAKGKTAVQYASERINEGSTIGDIIENTEMCTTLGGAYKSSADFDVQKEVVDADIEFTLYNDNPETANMKIVNPDKLIGDVREGQFVSPTDVYAGDLIEEYTENGEQKEKINPLFLVPIADEVRKAKEMMEELIGPFKADEDTSVLDAHKRILDIENNIEKAPESYAEKAPESNVKISEIEDDEEVASEKQLISFDEITKSEKPKQTTKQTEKQATAQKQTPEKTSEIKH